LEKLTSTYVHTNVKDMVNQIKYVTGKSIKEIVETLIRQQYRRIQLDREMIKK